MTSSTNLPKTAMFSFSDIGFLKIQALMAMPSTAA